MATGLEQLQQAGITVLWCHMHDYFSQQRGLKNLIWVYENDSVAQFNVSADYYYPGDDVTGFADPGRLS